MEYSIWLSWSMSNECIKITVHRSRRNRPLESKSCNFSQCYSYLFFSCPKHSGCFWGREEPISMFTMNLVQFQGCRRTRGHKSTILRKIHFKEIIFDGVKPFFPQKGQKMCGMLRDTASSWLKWKGRCRDWRTALQGATSSSWRWQVGDPSAAHEGKPNRTQHKQWAETGRGWVITASIHQIY